MGFGFGAFRFGFWTKDFASRRSSYAKTENPVFMGSVSKVGARVAYITANAKISLSVISPHFLSFSLYTQMALRASIPPVLYSAQSLVLGPL